MSCQSRFDARYWMLGAGALGRPRGMEWGGRREVNKMSQPDGWRPEVGNRSKVHLWWFLPFPPQYWGISKKTISIKPPTILLMKKKVAKTLLRNRIESVALFSPLATHQSSNSGSDFSLCFLYHLFPLHSHSYWTTLCPGHLCYGLSVCFMDVCNNFLPSLVLNSFTIQCSIK